MEDCPGVAACWGKYAPSAAELSYYSMCYSWRHLISVSGSQLFCDGDGACPVALVLSLCIFPLVYCKLRGYCTWWRPSLWWERIRTYWFRHRYFVMNPVFTLSYRCNISAQNVLTDFPFSQDITAQGALQIPSSAHRVKVSSTSVSHLAFRAEPVSTAQLGWWTPILYPAHHSATVLRAPMYQHFVLMERIQSTLPSRMRRSPNAYLASQAVTAG